MNRRIIDNTNHTELDLSLYGRGGLDEFIGLDVKTRNADGFTKESVRTNFQKDKAIELRDWLLEQYPVKPDNKTAFDVVDALPEGTYFLLDLSEDDFKTVELRQRTKNSYTELYARYEQNHAWLTRKPASFVKVLTGGLS